VKLSRVEFVNFKLLDGVVIDFSTEELKPLTVIRAANGSGKTSILYGLAWGIYGDPGLREDNLRLASSFQKIGAPITVQVVVDFEHTEDGISTSYVLTRSLEETPVSYERVEHKFKKLRLVKRLSAGEEEVKNPQQKLNQLFPLRLKDTFLTDGDKVQSFISGQEDRKERQHRVKEAIRGLLGLDNLEEVKRDLEHLERGFRKDLAEGGDKKLQEAQNHLTKAEIELNGLKQSRDEEAQKRAKIEDSIGTTEHELSEITGVGDIDQLNKEAASAGKAHSLAQKDMASYFENARAMFKSSEGFSWSLAEEPLREGQKVLADLADKGVIPGSSIGVLQDRLDIKTCICGESLEDGSSHRAQVEALIEEQSLISAERERLTATFHRTRAGLNSYESDCVDKRDFKSQRPLLLAQHADIEERLRDASARKRVVDEKIKLIDSEKVQRLTTRLAQAKRDHTESSEKIGALERSVALKDDERIISEKRFEEARKAAKGDDRARLRYEMTLDLKEVVTNTLNTLKTDHVRAISGLMNDLFMQIVGGNPELAGAVFRGVEISSDFDIVITSGDGALLDADFELNGASQRALTLAFIWALMEIADIVAPRLIDTPLGMTSGGVKQRMVEAISSPVTSGLLDYQVILLLTPSEIRDIESLLDERAGKYQTLSCSKDYPAELVHDWAEGGPRVRRCNCSHREYCEVCERTDDSSSGLDRRVS